MYNVDHATAYALRGWPCFPVAGKRPLTQHGYLDATTDRRELDRLFSRHPDAGVAIATGARSGFSVLDIDGEEGFESLRELELRHRPLPPTPTVLTPGGGEHRYFEYNAPVSCSAGLLGPGLDVRGDGGYVVAPPSLHPNGGFYAWASEGHPDDVPLAAAPDWLEAPTRRRAPLVTGTTDDRIPEGRRNRELFEMACGMRRRGARRGSIVLALQNENRERCDPPLPAAEIERITDSACRYASSTDVAIEFTAHVRLR